MLSFSVSFSVSFFASLSIDACVFRYFYFLPDVVSFDLGAGVLFVDSTSSAFFESSWIVSRFPPDVFCGRSETVFSSIVLGAVIEMMGSFGD